MVETSSDLFYFLEIQFISGAMSFLVETSSERSKFIFKILYLPRGREEEEGKGTGISLIQSKFDSTFLA